MPPLSKYPLAIDTIICAQVLEYQKMLLEPHSLPSNDKNLLKWRKAKVKALLETYGDELRKHEDVSLVKWGARHFSRFSGKKPAEAKRTHHAKADASDFKSIVCFPRPKPLRGRELFKQEVRPSINKELQAQRERGELTCGEQPAAFQSSLRERWDGLSDGERDEWSARAEAHHKAKFATATNTIYENQALLPQVLLDVTRGMIGMGANKVGRALIHILISYRNEAGALEAKYITVGHETGLDDFNPSWGNVSLADKWVEWSLPRIPAEDESHEEDRVMDIDTAGDITSASQEGSGGIPDMEDLLDSANDSMSGLEAHVNADPPAIASTTEAMLSGSPIADATSIENSEQHDATRTDLGIDVALGVASLSLGAPDNIERNTSVSGEGQRTRGGKAIKRKGGKTTHAPYRRALESKTNHVADNTISSRPRRDIRPTERALAGRR